MSIPLIFSYAAMYAVHAHGADLIGALWGPQARAAAVAQNVDAVQPDAAVDLLCGGYAAAHFDVTSNILHAAGMVAALYLAVQTVAGLALAATVGLPSHRSGTALAQFFLWVWPIYYLPAWVGHLWFQKDIPAVFTYGTTVRGWAAGEYCAFYDLFSGGIVFDVAEVLPSAVLTYLFVLSIETMSSSSSSSSSKADKKKSS